MDDYETATSTIKLIIFTHNEHRDINRSFLGLVNSGTVVRFIV